MISPSDIRIAVVGAGNLAWSLIPALQQAGLSVSALISRSLSKADFYCRTWGIKTGGTDLSLIPPEVNLIFFTVNDQALSEMMPQLAPFSERQVVCVHTSGSTPLNVWKSLGRFIGVFYPLQTFKAETVQDFSRIPVFLEGDRDVLKILRPVAELLSQKVQAMDSENRLRLHLGAVLVNNFTNCLYRLAQEINPSTDFSVYQPLINGHLEHVFSIGPAQSQTGPAIRGDISTLQKHLALLKDQPETAALYRQFSKIINPTLSLLPPLTSN
ncbi:MAG: DUF2520 domain-containing protein [Bacteroidia bacterium]|nr:DUF2520 domain-containing protein [Bacteroidia bacterium]